MNLPAKPPAVREHDPNNSAAPESDFICRACTHTKAVGTWRVAEQMFRLRDEFTYGECEVCGSLSIAEIPADLSKYYPSNYYAHSGSASPRAPTWRDIILDTSYPSILSGWRMYAPDKMARILDVGTGNGLCLQHLWKEGYQHLCGVDPHMPAQAVQSHPYPMIRGAIEDCDGDWDVIMYHHVLEHVMDPRQEIRAAGARLKPGGRLIVRVPVADSWAREHFGQNWLGWDPPRHLCVPSRAAIGEIASAAGMKVTSIVDDSRAFQYWASRLYARGVSFVLPPFAYYRRQKMVLSAPLYLAARAWARWLNFRRRGDQAIFIIEKS